ncbi:unnamed protein product [Strongylus vulgaris]|uniref:Uncharacterized protein n=1 Tax=Strongylus vulgaris TaxID=40348 RepID=A0A3P7LE35_STRVU|nr:unnamed protein product [Strongylus vulgaris]
MRNTEEEDGRNKRNAEMDGDARLPRTTHSHIQLIGTQIDTTIMTRTAQDIAAAVTGRVERDYMKKLVQKAELATSTR